MSSSVPTDQTASSSTVEMKNVLNDQDTNRWWKRRKLWLGVALLAVVVGGVYYTQFKPRSAAQPVYVTEALKKGNLTLTVSANGTLQPTRSVNIGSELSGTVRQVLVDVNDRVKQGQVLVVLDQAKLTDQVMRSRAGLSVAKSQLAQATATVKESRANLARLEEVARLSGGKVPSAAELDAARAGLDRALASEASAQSAIEQAKATLSTDETNLSRASIRSPIDGVVLSRNVDPGNAVAASLQAVTLMTIAEDLRHMRLEASVDEADVGAIKPGQAAYFTVSSYPSRKYPAKITRVAYGSTKTDNVVTYTTYLDVDNDDLSLRPGMTAAANIVATERTGVLLVPNTALRFTPIANNGNNASSGVLSKLMPRPPATGSRKMARTDSKAGTKQIWVLRDGQAVAMPVTTGITDGRQTEVSGEGLEEGLAVITDQRSNGAAR